MDGLIAGGLRVAEAAVTYRVAPQLTDHLDSFASSPEGFKRLRELVLNLAVRGRLVPQDSTDHPAERLIHKKRNANRQGTATTFLAFAAWLDVRYRPSPSNPASSPKSKS